MYNCEVTNLTAKKITLVDGNIIKPYETKTIKINNDSKFSVISQLRALAEANQIILEK